MSEKPPNHKFLVRPKVRFDQDQTIKCKLQNSCDPKDVGKNKPKITSIVNLKQPIKIISLKEPSKCPSNNKLNSNDKISTESPIAIQSQKGQPSPAGNSDTKKSDRNILKTSNTLLHNKSRTTKTTSQAIDQGNKENRTLVSRPCTKKTCESQKLKVPISVSSKSLEIQNVKKPLKSTCSVPLKKTPVQKKVSTTKPLLSLKDGKPKVKCTSVNIKKDLVRDIQGDHIKVSIEPGKSHLKESQVDKSNRYTIKSTDVGTRFQKSEYNSITSTIKELDKMKKESIVKDIQHLPIAQKNSLHKKISAALDYPSEEILYKDLIDLSIHESLLPNRLTRNKDPEPRHRDITPRLSDFYSPQDVEEYCTPARVELRHPRMMERSSAFKISDKIFEWKNNIDDEQ